MATKNVYDPITKTYSSGSAIPSNFVTDTNIQTPTASNLASVTTPKIPDLTSTNTNTASIYSGINANGSSYVDTTSNTVNNQANALNNTGASNDYYTKYLNDLSGVESVNASKIKSDLETQYGLTEKQAEANRLKAIINANTAEAEAAKLAQGQRLSSMGQISGAQADIERKLAIRNSPYIAQYQAALGDYEAAQNTVNSLYTAQLTDAQNEYDKKINLLNTAYSIATTKEKQDIEKEATKAQQDFELKKINIQKENEKELAKYEAELKGGSTGLSTISQAVIENPNLFNSLTATEKGNVISQLSASGYDTTQLGTKALSDTAIKEINQTNNALTSLSELKDVINNNLEYIGPIKGLSALNPWSKARQAQADVDRVRQVVGKALEGGVLRKEDEEKYKKILATLTDTPETALYKIDELINNITTTKDDYINLQTSSGKSLNVTSSLNKKGEIKKGQTTTGNSYTITKE